MGPTRFDMHDLSQRPGHLSLLRRVPGSVVFCCQLTLLATVFGSCTTKEPVEHLRAPARQTDETTNTPSEPPQNDAGRVVTSDGEDASVTNPTDDTAGAETVEREAGYGTAATETQSDAGKPPEQPPLAERVEAAILEQCSDAPHSSPTFTRKALRSAAADCAMWHYCSFEVVAKELDAAVRAYNDDPGEQNLEHARAVWRLAMANWSHVELFQFGPLGSQSQSAGKDMYEGSGIRELIYAWPSTSACRVDEQLISQNYVSRGMESALISGRGLFALEYLLFGTETSSACLANSTTAQDWSSLSQSEITRRKRDYAAAVSADIVQQVETLSEVWSPDGGNFKQTLVDAAGAYPSEQEAMKVIAWSLIYAERELKDWKLGIPAGYTLTHPVSDLETPYAKVGVENIRANLRGFRSLFQGCGADGAGVGFDDWLIEAGHPELADDIVAAWVVAQGAADDYSGSITEKSAALEDLYQAVKGLTSLLKSDLFGAGSPLNLELPGGVEGDTD